MKHQAVICVLLQLTFELSGGSLLRVVPGAAVELPCLSFHSDFTGATITWTHNGQNISGSAATPGSPEVRKDGLYLSLPSVIAADEGQYTCTMRENHMELSRTYTISVTASLPYSMTLHVGSTTRIPCYVPPSSPVEANAAWYHEDEGGRRTKLPLEDAAEDARIELLYPLDQDQSVIIRDAALEDAGIYHCELPEGRRLSTVYLNVVVGPTAAPHSCASWDAAWEPCLDLGGRTQEPVLQESLSEFSFKAFAFLREADPSANLLFSPISISSVLSHLLLGARGSTQRAIETAVSLPHQFHCVHAQMRKLREKLAGSLEMASQICYNPEINLSESFTNLSMQFYDAEPVRLQGGSEQNAQMINSWVANKTNNQIPRLVESVAPHTQLMLLNAVAFSGQWKVKFAQKASKGHFIKLDGDLVKVPLLYHQKYKASMAYVIELKAQVARFALTGDSSLYVLLPVATQASDLRKMEQGMSDAAVLRMVTQMEATPQQRIEVTLPQIRLDVQSDLNTLIKKLGLSALFEDANLCGMSSDKILLDDARHRAVLTLNERGVEAGAATTVAFSRSYPTFSAMRPFVMLLWSDRAAVPLFIGRVTDP